MKMEMDKTNKLKQEAEEYIDHDFGIDGAKGYAFSFRECLKIANPIWKWVYEGGIDLIVPVFIFVAFIFVTFALLASIVPVVILLPLIAVVVSLFIAVIVPDILILFVFIVTLSGVWLIRDITSLLPTFVDTVDSILLALWFICE